MARKVKSIASFATMQRVEDTLLEQGFMLTSSATVVSDGKFWHKMLYTKGDEMIFVSDEIGDAYPKDPIITIYGSEDTIKNITEVLT